MSEELGALRRMHQYDLVLLSSSVTPLSCRWVYKTKTRVDCSIERHKVCLIARDFIQEYRVDYEETLRQWPK